MFVAFQSAALVAIGILYEGSTHPQTMQLLLSEIGCRSGGDNALEREGYAVAAGIALGLVGLGRGKDALGSVESFVNRLFQYVGGREYHSVCCHDLERLHNVAPSVEEHNCSAGQMT
ncbi:Anaphase-promoting complex subunit [Thalictrum thalictroides]|uniref:Anaphase-promoting complex subunit n=1 Tax=Thalictrum thalictroides TaxID=46969 RepID=A0A7J6V4V1_THATH|nr:Anaphase-promoting complex subunit [Thalictrum thalictroides]